MVGGNDQVLFSQGAPGTRTKLWARVCQYVKEPQRCINQDAGLRGEAGVDDFYGEAPQPRPVRWRPERRPGHAGVRRRLAAGRGWSTDL